MKRGAWHQFGDRSQKLALEQLQIGAGVGVIISPRDLSFSLAEKYAIEYVETGADILVDQQFYIPDSVVGNLSSYPIGAHRNAISGLNQISDNDLTKLSSDLQVINATLKAGAVLAPAVVYEHGRPDIVDLNTRLFGASKSVAEALGIPCYATIVLGQSATTSEVTADATLSAATALHADGWYFAFEFNEERIPSTHSLLLRYLKAGLTLACTGLPVLHAYSGPLAPLSLACGGVGAGVGHSQNLWQFTRARWEPSDGSGGGGNAPPRYFSRGLWGTIVYEDEFALLSQGLRQQVLSTSPFSTDVSANPPYLPWKRWDANKHLVYVICKTVEGLCQNSDAELVLDDVMNLLTDAIHLHAQVATEGIQLGDNTTAYQVPFRAALASLKAGNGEDFELLRLLS